VDGKDASDFLQGLITNDMKHLEETAGHGRSLLAFCLNPSGRILADVIIYRSDVSCFLIECDNRVSCSLTKHLLTHKLRKKVSISLNSRMKVYSIFPSNLSVDGSQGKERVKTLESANDNFILVNDIRLPVSLYRLLHSGDEVDCKTASKILEEGVKETLPLS